MIDRLFSLALLFCVLAGGTAAIGSEWFAPQQRAIAADARVATLPRVVITGKKQPATTEVARVERQAGSDGVAKFTQ